MLYRVHVESIIAVLGPKKGERYLLDMARRLAREEDLASVFQIRPEAQRAELRRSRREAAAIFERLLPSFLAALPPK